MRRFATTKTYGGLKDSDRIFTNVYKDTDPYIKGALRRVLISIPREIGTEPKTSCLMDLIGSSTKSRCQGLEVEEVLVSHLDSNILSCPRLPPRKDLVTWSSTLTNHSLEHARIGKSCEVTPINLSKVLCW